MAHARVPKFGNWEQAGEVPYTQYFNDARKGRNAGKLFNPNDPHENPEAFSEDVPPVRAPPFRTGSDPEAPKVKDERPMGREDGNPRRPTNAPIRGATTNKPSSDSTHHQLGDRMNPRDSRKGGSRLSAGSDRSLEQSPLHPHNQVKPSSKGGVAPPSWEKRTSSEGHGHSPNIPGRSRMRTGIRGNESPDKGSTVPKFGEWNDDNPQAGEGYTDIFDLVSQEKKHGPKSPIISKEPSYPNGRRKKSTSDFAECPCFGWCRK